MQNLPILKAGDRVEIIAPASRCSTEVINRLRDLLHSWNLKCIINDTLFGDDLLCANSDEQRLRLLKEALTNSHTKAVICARGGYGSMRLIPGLSTLTKPMQPKLFVGMSDITALHLFFEEQWSWPTVHGALATDKFSLESIACLKDLLFANKPYIELSGLPLNRAAQTDHIIESTLTGGNLTLVQSSIGTLWQINGKNKIILLEEVAERGYRIDRMLEHLRQANMFKDAAAIMIGDFINGLEPDGSSLIQPVIERFAQQCSMPVVQITGVGHGYVNYPLPLGTRTQLHLGKQIILKCFR